MCDANVLLYDQQQQEVTNNYKYMNTFCANPEIFESNEQLTNLGKFDLLKMVERFEAVERIADRVTDEPSTSFAGAVSNGNGESIQWMEYVEIDTTYYHIPYTLPNKATVVYAVRCTFGEDDDRRTREPERGNPGVWRIETKNLDKYRGVTDIRISQTEIIGKCEIKKAKVVVKEGGRIMRKVVRNPDDLLITLLDADTYPLKTISNEDIDRKIVELGVGRVKKALQQQFHRGTVEPCGNKFLVLENVSNADNIPRSLEFYDPKFGVLQIMLKHRLQKRRCYFCGQFHDAVCPKKEQIRNLELEREIARRDNAKVKIYSDSTLRKANQQCLSGDVDAMSGGTIGNILNAVRVDENNDVGHVVLVAGANDMRRRCDLDEYVYSVQRIKERILPLLKEKSVSIMLPPKQVTFVGEEHIKQEFLLEEIKSLQSEGLTVIENPVTDYVEDGGLHPSPEQTINICRSIDGATSEKEIPLILPSATDDLMAGNHLYQKVNSLYKYGCAACDDTKQNRWYFLCDVCKESLKSNEITISKTEELKVRIVQWETTESPFLHSGDTDDDDMSEEDALLPSGGKRERSPQKSDDVKRGRRSLKKSVPTKSVSVEV